MDTRAFDEAYKKLNKSQREAVDFIDGPLMVVAGPGSGKTQILALRVANILRKTDTPPNGILCLTFTDAAAVNMLNRLKTIIGTDAYKVNIFTFHSFGTHIIGRYPEFFFNHARLSPADELVQREIMTEIFENLPHRNPFSSFHPENGFVFLKDALSRISQLKKAGIAPEEFGEIIKNNESAILEMNLGLGEVFSEKLSAKIYPKIESLLKKWEDISVSDKSFDYWKPISVTLYSALRKALDSALSSGKTAPISEWKKKYTGGTNENIFLKSFETLEKLKALEVVYSKYKAELYNRGYYDYDDMILEVVNAMRKNENLRAEMQEQFLYTMIDEFQDTNDGQIRLIRLLAENPVNERKPNVMVVGDDDQAIYRFQGADVSNIRDFHSLYDGVNIVVMTENYRSTQSILDIARKIILTGENRLENIVSGIDKNLVSKGEVIHPGEIKKLKFTTKEHQYHNISIKIKKLIEEGHEPREIAVISRKHKELENLVYYLHHHKIPIVYEKQQNILATPHINQLIQMCRFISNLSLGPSSSDSLMPEILSYPFFNISPKTIWEISLQARPKGKDSDSDIPWLSVMLDHEDKKVKDIAEFFVSLSTRAKYEPVEYILESLIGAHIPLAPDSETDEEAQEENNERKFVSPYKEYYFSREKLSKNKPEYLRFLSGLKFFISALRNHKIQSLLKVSDLVLFVDTHEKSDILLNDTSPFTGAENAVQLMTAHKSKGLEFETVFLLSCQDDVWSKGGNRNKIRLPENLPITPEEDEEDDLRLFYVALTRAKSRLYLSSYKFTDAGKESVEVKFLNIGDTEEDQSFDEDIDTSAILETTTPNYKDRAYIESEKAFLAPLVENYKLSVSHFNNFLDIVRGDGPMTFFEQNLVRFPQPMSVYNIFGSSIHKAIELAILSNKEKGVLPEKEEVKRYFEKDISRRRLAETDLNKYLEKGKDALEVFYDLRIKEFQKNDRSELDFSAEGVLIDGAHITGKIDLWRPLSGSTSLVFDFKTGKPVMDDAKDEKAKEKEWKFKNQFVFYKLLVENSKNYKNYEVKKGSFVFVEPHYKDGVPEIIEQEYSPEDVDIERSKKLIGVVYKKIKDLDFPDVSKYPKSMKGIEMFEDDLLEGRI